MKYFLIACLHSILLFITVNTFAQNLNEILAIDSDVRIGKLPNGLTYYIRHNEKPESKVEMRLAVNAGSVLEDDDQQGLAHFTEHMAFNGTTHFKKNDLVDFLQKIGVKFGADLNAYTSFDETVYILPIPLDDTSNMRKGLQVLQDWAQGLSFDNDQIDGERGVVLEESRLGKGADDRMFRKIFPVQYNGSLYAERLPIGKDSILKTFSYDVVKRFYHDWYRPDLQAVLIVGDVDVDKTEALIKAYFSGLKNPENERPRINATVNARDKNEAMVLTDKEATNYFAEVDYPAIPSKPTVTVNDYRNDLIKELFSSMLNDRLSELSRSSNTPFLYGSVGFGSFARGYDAVSAFAVAGQQGTDTALSVLLREIERVKQFGFTEAELERNKNDILSGFEKLYNNRSKTESSNFISEYIRNFLTQEPMPGIAKEWEYHQQLIPGISLVEVNALAEPLKQNPKIFVSLQGPEKETNSLPDDKTLLVNTLAYMQQPVSPYTEKTIASSLIDKTPIAGKIIKETKDEKLGTTEIDFANGAKVIIKPTDFKDDEILMSSFHKGGLSKYGVEDKYNANYASSIVQQMGIGNFSPTDLTKFLSGKNVSVFPRIGNLSASIGGNAAVKDFETLLQLVYLYSTAPKKDEALFSAWKEKQKSAIEFSMKDPKTAFLDSFYTTLYNDNPLMGIFVAKPDIFDKINLDRLMQIYKEQLGDAQDFTFIFTGNVDIEKARPLLAEYIGSLPSSGKAASFADNGLRPISGNHKITVHKGTAPKSFILTSFTGEIKYNVNLAFYAQALTEILNIKIVDDLREKLGAIYGGGISGGLSKIPYNSFSFTMQLPCGPENVDTLLKSATAEIEKIKNNGPEQSDLDKVKKQWLEKYKVSIKDNGFWTGRLQAIWFQGDEPQRIFDYEKNVNAITVDDIKMAANKLFSAANTLQGVLMPEE